MLHRIEAAGFRTRPLSGQPRFHQVAEGPYPISATLEHWAGRIYVQQASTGLAAPALAPGAGDRVLDLCAAPGGKTTHLSELVGDEGCVVSSDVSESRLRGLLGNVYRLGLGNVLTVAADGRDFPAGAPFDHVLADVPCSGEGTLRRRGGRLPRQSRSFLGYVTSAQRALLERAVELVRPGGTVLYVTCTFAPEENEAVLSDALRRLPVELEPLGLPVPHAPGVTSFDGVSFDPRVEGAARIYPHHLDSGGLFLARLRRKDGDARAAGEPPPGWSPVRESFPEVGDGAAAEHSSDEAGDLVARARAELGERFGVPEAALERYRWTARGGRVWVHLLDRWPLDAWSGGGWRAVALGLRAVEFDSRGRARPTNDALRLFSPYLTGRRVAVDRETLGRLLRREVVRPGGWLDGTAPGESGPGRAEAYDPPFLGPAALALEGEVVGRAASTRDGLKSEVPKARAADLRRVLDSTAAPKEDGSAPAGPGSG